MLILIIDHETTFLNALQSAFEKQGCKVITTTDSEIASTLFFQHKPEAVIFNICMPDKDGFELVKEIRGFCQRTFILAVSTQEFYLRMIRKLGANKALSKATEPELLITQFRVALFFSCLKTNSFKKPVCMACNKIKMCGL